ncbi:hypothetical protein EYZ11_002885 [Aspergillus tanneri]|uniref:High-affinity Zn(2+) transporter zrt1 n=1 Tax=Aspergillus tanneri TaxID=1220188 RepID=A0A4S3JPP5_9EURO|nr:uncharacterized protein ATNIH1004_001308 [Aspergillus tanneri]KAA8652404.1 hypothetical protein ATNIH1004_001308 [Aspergillus tanneri]THC97659.1 hypothetical protein EYZ11_002885 [Aspergillus tanneri]
MAASSDLRGWIMSAVSGVACVLGSSVICIDVLLRRFSHRKNFQIVNNNAFLSASLGLSAGVMLFTSLYSMLPTSLEYLTRAGLSPSLAAYSLIGLFLAGVIVIRLLSALLHHYIPSHVVDCAHSHEPHPPADLEHGRHHDFPITEINGRPTERTSLLPRADQSIPTVPREPWRMRIVRRFNRLMGGVKTQCDESGPCYGISQTCGHECSKTLVAVGDDSFLPPISRSNATPLPRDSDQLVCQTADPLDSHPTPQRETNATSSSSSSHTGLPGTPAADAIKSVPSGSHQHHHHVPQNAFLSIGLQTSVAIALHKLPEGFITYATNHASPTLGTTVFLALFIHNISEGFAMALPLYLALHSRAKAMFWSSLLGGISQPAGAALAALWIWGARHTGGPGDDTSGPAWGVYGGMFAATAGVMTSVALQLFSEGLALTHRRGMCIGFAIGGMGLMGLSFALTA